MKLVAGPDRVCRASHLAPVADGRTLNPLNGDKIFYLRKLKAKAAKIEGEELIESKEDKKAK
jgi:hypothetical protein